MYMIRKARTARGGTPKLVELVVVLVERPVLVNVVVIVVGPVEVVVFVVVLSWGSS